MNGYEPRVSYLVELESQIKYDLLSNFVFNRENCSGVVACSSSCESAMAICAVAYSGATRLLLLTAHETQWRGIGARPLQQLTRRLSSLGAAQMPLRIPNGTRLGGSSTSFCGSEGWTRRMLSTAPTDNNNSSYKQDRDDEKQQQKTSEREARTIKQKLAADIEKARNLVRFPVISSVGTGVANAETGKNVCMIVCRY